MKAAARFSWVVGYNSLGGLCHGAEILGAKFPYPFERSREDARTNFTNVDGRDVRPQAKAKGTQALPVRPDA
jgi:hypothetical protein